MYLPIPDFKEDASPAEIKRYLVKFSEAVEKRIRALEDKVSLADSEN